MNASVGAVSPACMNKITKEERAPSWLWHLFWLVAVFALFAVFAIRVYRPDTPIATIIPGSSAEPSFAVQIIRPREGLPLGGLLPPHLFGVDAKLGFDSQSAKSSYTLESTRLKLSGANWELLLVYDPMGQIQPDSEVVFDLLFENRSRRVRCKPSIPPVGTLERSEIASNEFSGAFVIELPICEDAETGRSLGWPFKPLIMRGSFDRLPTVDHPE